MGFHGFSPSHCMMGGSIACSPMAKSRISNRFTPGSGWTGPPISTWGNAAWPSIPCMLHGRSGPCLWCACAHPYGAPRCIPPASAGDPPTGFRRCCAFRPGLRPAALGILALPGLSVPGDAIARRVCTNASAPPRLPPSSLPSPIFPKSRPGGKVFCASRSASTDQIYHYLFL